MEERNFSSQYDKYWPVPRNSISDEELQKTIDNYIRENSITLQLMILLDEKLRRNEIY